MNAEARLRFVKVVHTLVWAVFAGCVLAIPVFTYQGKLVISAGLIFIVLGESTVLVANRMRCPLTDVAARYTDDRRDNFDIYLPMWLAKYNKLIFGTLYVAGIAYTLVAWVYG